MNAAEFVDSIRRVVIDQTVADTVSCLEMPPGRRPAVELVELSGWYGKLDEADRSMIRRLVSMVSRDSVFALLTVLDGSRQVDPAFTPGDYFELRHVTDGSVEILSGPRGGVLHELV